MNRLDLASMQLDQLLNHEWLAVNKLGGYACSTIPGLNTRKYHGLLVAALSAPVRRMVLLSRVEETVSTSEQVWRLASNEYAGAISPKGYELLRAFNSDPFPRWAFQADGWTLEKSLRLMPGENTVCISYTLLGGDRSIELDVRPLMALRGIHELMFQWNGKLEPVTVTTEANGPHPVYVRIPPTSRTPEVFLTADGDFKPEHYWYLNTIYRREEERGYSGLEDLWNPGVFKWILAPGQTVHLFCSSEPIDFDRALTRLDRPEHQTFAPGWFSDQIMDTLLRAADQFVLDLPQEDLTFLPNVITRYPWAAPIGRDALIALPGLFLIPGKFNAARNLLATFIGKLNRGLMPSHWPEDGSAPEYHGADVSLWFINAVWQYLQYTGDEKYVRQWFDSMLEIVRAYQHGTGLGLSADHDGLLTSHEANQPSSWMDAKIGDWVVTPRQGRTVELNALWYNALCIVSKLAERFGQSDQAQQLMVQANGVRLAFNLRFWNDERQCLFDVISDHGHDASVRPNQIFALSLPFAVLRLDRHAQVMKKIETDLLTPFGLRTLSPHDAGYSGRYAGNVVMRDKAYHQGSAFPWLLGAYITAYLRLHGRSDEVRAEARKLLEPCIGYVTSDGLGQLCELFDGDAPHTPGGAIASSRAIGELLRAYREDVLNQYPPSTVAPASTTVELSQLIIAPL